MGKSELARYYLRTRHSGGRLSTVVVVDARRLRAASLAEKAHTIDLLGVAPKETIINIIKEIAGSQRIGIADLALKILLALKAALGSSRFVLLVDEFHELPGYSMVKREEALDDLRSLAALLAKSNGEIRVVVTVSEGFAATHDALSRLEGYSAGWLLVEHMDWPHFEALHREYSGRRGCSLSSREVYSLIGGTPGGLPDLCPLTPGELVEARIPAWIGIVEGALSHARNKLESRGVLVEPGELIAWAFRVLSEPLKPLRDPGLYLLGEALVEYNVAYAKRAVGGVRYLPQYPVYRAILEEAVEEGAESLLDVDPRRVYERAVGGGGSPGQPGA